MKKSFGLFLHNNKSVNKRAQVHLNHSQYRFYCQAELCERIPSQCGGENKIMFHGTTRHQKESFIHKAFPKGFSMNKISKNKHKVFIKKNLCKSSMWNNADV